MNDLVNQLVSAIADRICERVAEVSNKENEKLYSVKEVCEMVKVSHSTFYRHKNAGWIVPTCYVGRKPLFNQESIKHYLEVFNQQVL